MDSGPEFLIGVLAHADYTITSPLDPGNRIFVLYIFSIAGFCLLHLARGQKAERRDGRHFSEVPVC